MLLALLCLAAFTPIFAAGRLAEGTVPIVVLVWLRFFGGAITISCVATIRRTPVFSGLSPLWKLHFLRAVCAVGSLGFTVYAASLLPLADVTAIGLTKGIIAIGLAGLVLKEVISSRHWMAGILCSLGAYLVVMSVTPVSGPVTFAIHGIIAALLGAVCMACEGLILRYISPREDTATILVYVNVLAASLLAGPALFLIFRHSVDWSDVLAFAWMGPLAIAGQSLNVSAYRRAGAATLAPVYYVTVLFSAAFGYVMWGDVPSPIAGLGAAVIVAGGLVLTLPNPFRKQC